MASGSFALVFILVIGMMLTLLYFATSYSEVITVTTKPRLSQNDAIHIAEIDLGSKLQDFEGISHIIVNSTSGYVPFSEFQSKNLTLPLIYVYPNGTLVNISTNGDDDIGQCDFGQATYCGFLPPFNFNLKGRLVYAVEVIARDVDATGPYLYMVDAINGKIVDSTFLRNDKLS